ncbi:MAG: ATPase, T2SS/T4P/T4SS family, partial [Opitutaceae bacterium]
MSSTSIAGTLRRSLLIKVISKHAPSRDDVSAIIELTAAKVVEALTAESMTFYLVEGNEIALKQVYYSPTLWAGNPGKEKHFQSTAEKLIEMKVPLRQGIVGKVIDSGKPEFYRQSTSRAPFTDSVTKITGYEVRSMLTVPLKTNITLGAIQVLNKEKAAGTNGEFTERDLQLLQEVAEYSAALIQRMLDPKFQLSAQDTAKFVARFTDLPLITNADDVKVDKELADQVGDAVMRREGIFPYRFLGPNSVAVVTPNPLDYGKREEFTRATGFSLDEVSVVSTTVFDQLIQVHFRNSKDLLENKIKDIASSLDIGLVAEEISDSYEAQGGDITSVKELEKEDSAPIIQLTNRIVEDAYVSGASDIHIEPMEKELVIRYRIDGVCQDKLRMPKQVANGLVTRLKIMANLDISER